MKLLENSQIKSAIKECQPYKIAVAYIGANWRTYINRPNALDAVIISPTLGSNPDAIVEMANLIGWEKVFLLDQLHAKIYLGRNSAVIGSANLTYNGLSGQGLIEMCVEIQKKSNLSRIVVFMEQIQQIASLSYPTKESKLDRINKLQKAFNAAVSSGIMRDKGKNKQFGEFQLLNNKQFYVLWYQTGRSKYSEELEIIKSVIKRDIHFKNEDNVEKDNWALTWSITDDDKPHKTAKLSWLYIHDVIPNGITDENYEYPKVAIERKDKYTPHPPFALTLDVQRAFREAVVDKKISKYLVQKGTFGLEYSYKGLPLLIERMKQIIK